MHQPIDDIALDRLRKPSMMLMNGEVFAYTCRQPFDAEWWIAGYWRNIVLVTRSRQAYVTWK